MVESLSGTFQGPRISKGTVSRLPLGESEGGLLGALGPKLSMGWARPINHAFLLKSDAMA